MRFLSWLRCVPKCRSNLILLRCPSICLSFFLYLSHCIVFQFWLFSHFLFLNVQLYMHFIVYFTMICLFYILKAQPTKRKREKGIQIDSEMKYAILGSAEPMFHFCLKLTCLTSFFTWHPIFIYMFVVSTSVCLSNRLSPLSLSLSTFYSPLKLK